MANNISTLTGEEFYSGPWQGVQEVLAVLKIGNAKLDSLTAESVNSFQERADREIDGILFDLYHVPFRAKYTMTPLGAYVLSFPGDLRSAAIYYTAGLLMASEFQATQSNMNDQTNVILDKAKNMVYDLKRNTHWIPASERKSNISRTMPPSWQPAWTNQPQ
jgi:hypothetical protein